MRSDLYRIKLSLCTLVIVMKWFLLWLGFGGVFTVVSGERVGEVSSSLLIFQAFSNLGPDVSFLSLGLIVGFFTRIEEGLGM